MTAVKNTIVLLLSLFAAFLVAYIIGAFYCWGVNPANWNSDSRQCLVVLASVAGALVGVLNMDLSSIEKK